MNNTYELRIHKDIDAVIFKYNERYFPETDTELNLYNKFKLNIMLTNGLAAVLNKRNDIYNTFCGDMLFFSPAELHHGRVLRQGIHKYVEILIPTDTFDLIFPNYKMNLEIFNENGQNRTNFVSPKPEDREKILLFAEEIKNAVSEESKINDIELFMLLVEIINLGNKIYSKRDKQLSDNVPAVVEKSIDYMKEKFAENITIEDIANKLNCSSSYISRVFKKHTGKTPYAYLTEYRLFKAEQLLRGGESITTAALMSGFCNSSVFIKTFKKSFGITPHKYKKAREGEI